MGNNAFNSHEIKSNLCELGSQNLHSEDFSEDFVPGEPDQK